MATDVRVKVAIAVVEADGIQAPMVVTRSELKGAGVAEIPDVAMVVVFCPRGMGAQVQQRLHEWDAERLLAEMDPRGRVS